MSKQAILKLLASFGVRLTGVAGWLVQLILPVAIDKLIKFLTAKHREHQRNKQAAEAAKAAAEKAKQATDENSTDSAIDDQLGNF